MAHIRSINLAATAAVLLSASSAWALPGAGLSAIDLGQHLAGVKTALQGAGLSITMLDPKKAQQYARGLAAGNFLAMLNRAGASHSLLNEPGTRNISFIVATARGRTLMLAFAEDKLEALMEIAQVVPDRQARGRDNPFYPQRLTPIKTFLGTYQRGCRAATTTPRATNHFTWRGACGATRLYLEYRPRKDRFWVLFHK